MKLRTVAEFASELHVEPKDARGLVTFMVATGLAKFRGERPTPRGKGPHVYAVELGAGLRLRRLVEALE